MTQTLRNELIYKVVKNWNDRIKQLLNVIKVKLLCSAGTSVRRFAGSVHMYTGYFLKSMCFGLLYKQQFRSLEQLFENSAVCVHVWTGRS